MKTFVIGDIHGAYKSLIECLKLSKFNKKADRLICLGDVCDRGAQVKECIDELLTIPNCIFILGNHDAWALDWAVTGNPQKEWLLQGGTSTLMSYNGKIPLAHIRFLSEAPIYFVDKKRLFVHGGFDPERPVEETPKEVLLWDRNLLTQAQQRNQINPDFKFGNYDEVYIGHTPTINFGKNTPQKFCNIWAVDTGAGWGEKLSMMDIETKQCWQSIAA